MLSYVYKFFRCLFFPITRHGHVQRSRFARPSSVDAAFAGRLTDVLWWLERESQVDAQGSFLVTRGCVAGLVFSSSVQVGLGGTVSWWGLPFCQGTVGSEKFHVGLALFHHCRRAPLACFLPDSLAVVKSATRINLGLTACQLQCRVGHGIRLPVPVQLAALPFNVMLTLEGHPCGRLFGLGRRCRPHKSRRARVCVTL